MASIVRANLEHIAEVAPLFDQYRVFYKQVSNEQAALQFLKERFKKKNPSSFLPI